MVSYMLNEQVKLVLQCGNAEVKRWHNIKLGETWRVEFCGPTEGHFSHAALNREHWCTVKTPYTDDTCADTDIMYTVYLEEVFNLTLLWLMTGGRRSQILYSVDSNVPIIVSA